MNTVAIAVSGGIDSLFALVSLQEQGHSVMAIHALMHESPQKSPVNALKETCDKLAVPLHFVDLRQSFTKHVISPFVATYLAGQTPNPCALCNLHIKFGLLQDEAKKLGASHFATGHYAKLVEHPQYGRVLQSATDNAKDQTYFLSLTPSAQFDDVLFPLADTTKEAIRKYIYARGLAVPVSTESQDICFIPSKGYQAFLQAQGVKAKKGDICLEDGRVIGTHEGLWQYTEGQRKGLGIGWQEPLYVVAKDIPNNKLLVGTQEAIKQTSVMAKDIICHVPVSLWPKDVLVAVRYRQKAQSASVVLEDATLKAHFHTPQNMAAAGQVMVVSDMQQHILAAGIII